MQRGHCPQSRAQSTTRKLVDVSGWDYTPGALSTPRWGDGKERLLVLYRGRSRLCNCYSSQPSQWPLVSLHLQEPMRDEKSPSALCRRVDARVSSYSFAPETRHLAARSSTMPFTSPSYIPQLPFSPPESVPIHEFLFGRESTSKYGRRHSLSASKPPFICGVTGQFHSALEVAERIDLLARGLASELGWKVNEGDPFDKTLAIFSLNTVRPTFALCLLSRLFCHSALFELKTVLLIQDRYRLIHLRSHGLPTASMEFRFPSAHFTRSMSLQPS